VAPWKNEQVPVVVREPVHHHHYGVAPVKDKKLLVGLTLVFRTENTARRLLAKNILNTPWRPEIAHPDHS
jgi:hypothetical protein